MDQVLEVIKRRRSVRRFLTDQIDRDEVGRILDGALWAPSGHNAQPWHFLVLRDEALLDDLAQRTHALMAKSPCEWVRKLAARPGYHVFHHAPTVVVVSSEAEDVESGVLSYAADCSAAIQNMLLVAEAMNIGSCWIGLTKILFASGWDGTPLGIPEGYHPIYSIALGYKATPPSLEGPARRENTVTWYGEKDRGAVRG